MEEKYNKFYVIHKNLLIPIEKIKKLSDFELDILYNEILKQI